VLSLKNVGHSLKLYKDRVNRDVLKYSFANRVIEQWNTLPEKVIGLFSGMHLLYRSLSNGTCAESYFNYNLRL